MKRSLFFLLTLSVLGLSFSIYAQPISHLSQPVLWVKADSATLSDAQWRNILENDYAFTLSSGALPDSFARLNFNPAFEIDSAYFTASGVMLRHQDMTAIMVYRLVDSAAEQALWSMPLNDSLRIGLTTHQMLGEKGDLTYRTDNNLITVVHTLFRNWEHRDSVPTGKTFYMLKADSLPFRGKVSEWLLFDWHLDDTTFVQYISYLSVKYGITLYKTDYLSSDKKKIWDYHNNPDYSYSIAGIGRDDTMGLYQKQSYMLDEKIVIGLDAKAATNAENQGTLENGEFLIWGFDSSLLTRNGMIYLDNGEEFEIYGNGMFQGTKAQFSMPDPQRNIFMLVDGSNWEGTIENYYLLIDRSGLGEFKPGAIDFYMPDYVDSNNILHFSNIAWDTDTNGIDRFCFTYVPVDSILQNRNLLVNDGNNGTKEQENSSKDNATNYSQGRLNGNEYRIYPNPSNGDFVLEVNFAKTSDITVILYTPEGKEIERRKGKQKKNYRFNYHLDVSGRYLMDISGGGEQKTLKVVITAR